MVDPHAPGPFVGATPTEASAETRAIGQRSTNILWERTQACIAITVTVATLYVAASLAIKDNGEMGAFLLLSNAFFLVIGFYFGRTNHQRVGGVDLGR